MKNVQNTYQVAPSRRTAEVLLQNPDGGFCLRDVRAKVSDETGSVSGEASSSSAAANVAAVTSNSDTMLRSVDEVEKDEQKGNGALL